MTRCHNRSLPGVRLFLAIAVMAACAPSASAAEEGSSEVRAFLSTYCAACHADEDADGDFRIDRLRRSETAADAENWRLVLDNLHLGEMPPEDAEQPPAEAVERITGWIEQELRRAARMLSGETGEVVLRRLNRREYENTIEDLFGVRGDYAEGFPEDARAEGFDNNGAALMLSAEQVEQYLRAADFVLDRAIVTRPKPPRKSSRFTLLDLEKLKRQKEQAAARRRAAKGYEPTEAEKRRNEKQRASGNYGRPYYPAYGDDALIPVKYLKPNTRDFFRVREPGWYRFAVVAYAVRNEGEPIRLQVSCGSGSKDEIPRVTDVIQLSDAEPERFEYRVYLQPNERVELEMLDGTNWLPGSRIAEDRSPAVAVRQIEIEGPLIEQWPPRGHRLLFGEVDVASLDDAQATERISAVAASLFRRPVPEPVLESFVGFYRQQRSELKPLEAFRLTVKAMMASPLFLYHVEPAGEVDSFAFANRLSYFLWRSAPDERLLGLARSGSLLDPIVRRVEIERLMSDPKVERFLEDFTSQWLQTELVGEMQPDQNLYPEYDEALERAMVAETHGFIAELFDQDLRLNNLVDSDWTILNDRLARHYGIGGVEGNEFRKVALDKQQTVRGGLLTQASILSVTSNGTTTSPVIRGVWVLERLLGTPAPPPPPDVPAIEPDIRGATTIQEQLARHREIEQCNTCHRKIDPYGMALENFDVIGGWRDRYRALVQPEGKRQAQLGEGKRVEVAGTVPQMGAYRSFREFRELLAEREQQVVRNVAEKLATFALGRAMTFADRERIQKVVDATERASGGMRTLVAELCRSELFLQP